MRPVSITTTIARPREAVFDYLADVANHPEFADHFLVDWHLTREDSYGLGAGARFKVKQRFNRFAYGEETLTEAQRPGRLVFLGRGGRYNRVRILTTWTLEPATGDGTRLRFETESDPATSADRVLGVLYGTSRLARRGSARALARLRSILEDDDGRGARATLSGGARKPASGFRL